MMREFAYFCRQNITWVPPFVVLVILFMALCLALYGLTKSRGYLVTFFSGFCYLVPWFLQCVLR
jgi:hypothetical protein